MSRETTTFSTGEEAFQRDYQGKAILQKTFHTAIADNLIDYIVENFKAGSTIKIADLGCGDGSATRYIFDKLSLLNFKIEMTGFDISSEQIKLANQQNTDANKPTHAGLLRFQQHDMANELPESNFDIIISLFSLHWLGPEKYPAAIESVSNALKDEGTFMFFAPLEKVEFFEARKNLMNSTKWKDYFYKYNMLPFFETKEQYTKQLHQFTFQNSQQSETEKAKSGTAPGMAVDGSTIVTFEEVEKFKQFLQSWMQELRHLKNRPDLTPEAQQRLVDEYLKDLLSQLPEQDSGTAHNKGSFGIGNYPNCHNVEKTPKSTIQFCERFLWFYGTKKQTAHKVNAAEEGDDVQPPQP